MMGEQETPTHQQEEREQETLTLRRAEGAADDDQEQEEQLWFEPNWHELEASPEKDQYEEMRQDEGEGIFSHSHSNKNTMARTWGAGEAEGRRDEAIAAGGAARPRHDTRKNVKKQNVTMGETSLTAVGSMTGWEQRQIRDPHEQERRREPPNIPARQDTHGGGGEARGVRDVQREDDLARRVAEGRRQLLEAMARLEEIQAEYRTRMEREIHPGTTIDQV
jgi:hypothetical protein